jgi:hypothetical protein
MDDPLFQKYLKVEYPRAAKKAGAKKKTTRT